jgi:predicted nucleotidyltransferase
VVIDLAEVAKTRGCNEYCLNIASRLRALILRKYQDKFRFVMLFGPLVRGRFTQLSDIDISVKARNLEDLADVLPQFIIDAALELGVVEDKIDVVVLNVGDLPIGLRFDAVVRGVPIYISDWNEYVREFVKVFSEYADFQIFNRANRLGERYLEALRRIAYG